MKKRFIILGVIILLIAATAITAFILLSNEKPTDTLSANSISILQVSGTVEVERPPDILAAREGMRLLNLDTIRTRNASSAWLSLDDYKAVEISEWTALHLDRQERGFVLTLDYGEIKTRIDQPLYADEEFMIKAGGLGLSVRGTVFTVNYIDNIVTVTVESGAVAVLDMHGNEIEVLNAGASGEYEAMLGSKTEAEATPMLGLTYKDLFEIKEFGGYSWLVLEERDGKALLLSEYILEARMYHVERYYDWNTETPPGEEFATTWSDCDLRTYLNGDFLNRFNVDDRARIVQTRNSNKDNPWNGTFGGSDTDDFIFLLSLEEVVKYFGDSGQLESRPPGMSYIEGRYIYTTEIEDQYSNARKAYELAVDGVDGFINPWWLRSPGNVSFTAASVTSDGHIAVDGFIVFNSVSGVRPALWLNLQSDNAPSE